MKRQMNLRWAEVLWQRPYEIENIYELLTHLASTSPRAPIVWEARGSGGRVRLLIGTDRRYMGNIQAVFMANGDVRFSDLSNCERRAMHTVKQLKISKPVLSLKTDTALVTIRAGLAALSAVPLDQEMTVQIVLGASFAPRPTQENLSDPHASWLSVISGDVPPVSSESMKVIRDKSSLHRFSAVIRVGVSSVGGTAYSLCTSLLSALRTLETVGVRISTVSDSPEHLNSAYVPWHFPLLLSIKELASFMLLPIGDTALPGVAGLHPKLLLPPKDYRSPYPELNRSFALSSDDETRLSISPADALEHTVILGATGSGKSTVLLNMILADIRLGRSVLVIDPKSDLITDILERMPSERDDDVVIIDPSDPCPVGFNPFALTGYNNPTLITDALLSVFQGIFKDNWGIRSQDVLSAAFLSLAQTEGASLLWLPALLSNQAFRSNITAKLNDLIGLKSFWDGFEQMKNSERRAEIAPVLNKVRQFLLRPALRNVLGQSRPKFELTDLFHKRKIVLVPLNKGTIGSESAQLLGSLIVGLTWTLALSRASIPPEKRHIICVFIDELQDYLRLPTDLSDALSQARGLGMALTLAHQYRAQLPAEISAGIDANARNKIVFGLNGIDAKAMAAMAHDLEPIDFESLRRYQVYTRFQYGGKSTGWVSAQTLPKPPASRSSVELRAESMSRYGCLKEQVEREYLEILPISSHCSPYDDSDIANPDYGRRNSP